MPSYTSSPPSLHTPSKPINLTSKPKFYPSLSHNSGNPETPVKRVLKGIASRIGEEKGFSDDLLSAITPAQRDLLDYIKQGGERFNALYSNTFQNYSPNPPAPLLENIGLSPQQRELLGSLKQIRAAIANPVVPPLEFTKYIAYKVEQGSDFKYSISSAELASCIEKTQKIHSGELSEGAIVEVNNTLDQDRRDLYSASIKYFLDIEQHYVDFASSTETTALLQRHYEQGLEKVGTAKQSLNTVLEASKGNFVSQVRENFAAR
jgi:hypothetical protein